MFELLNIITKRFKTIFLVSLIATIGAAVLSFLLPDIYSSKALVLPLNPNFLDRTFVFGNEGGDEPRYVFGGKQDVDRLISLGESNATHAYLVEKFGLYKHYKIDPASQYASFKVVERLKKNYTIIKNAAGIVEIEVLDKEPDFASVMANDIASKLDKDYKNLILSKKAELRDMLGWKMGEQRLKVNRLADSLRMHSQSFPNDTVTAYIMGVVLKKEVHEYGNIAQSFNQYKTIIEQDISALHYLEKAIPADRKTKPVRSMIVLGAFIFTFFLMSLWAVFADKYRSYLREYA